MELKKEDLAEILKTQYESKMKEIDEYNSPILKQVALCAEAMGLDWSVYKHNDPQHTIRYLDGDVGYGSFLSYWPITNDQQAMALVKRFMLTINAFVGSAEFYTHESKFKSFNDDSLNYAIVECVAKRQLEYPVSKIHDINIDTVILGDDNGSCSGE